MSMKKESLTKEQVIHDYKDVFSGLGKLLGTYHIETDPSVKPVQNNPRRVPVPVQEELKDKIDKLERKGILAKVKNLHPGSVVWSLSATQTS